jgi:ATPase subunit of ABC transporter with duplicated ATPase domains
MYYKLTLEKPGILILDEYEGTMILVSHIDEFVWQVRIDEYLELE